MGESVIEVKASGRYAYVRLASAYDVIHVVDVVEGRVVAERELWSTSLLFPAS